MLVRNSQNFLTDVIGMPNHHKDAFLAVAQSEKCVIMVRATGPTCHGLLAEGYDTKGYRIHGKSCDWGPMAGFVMRDPRLNKYGTGKEGFNREKHREAIELDHEGQGWKASVTPLEISPARVEWLKSTGRITVEAKSGRLDGTAGHGSKISFHYSLIKTSDGMRYGVYFDNNRSDGKKWIQEKGAASVKIHPKWGARYEQMLAMTNPPGHRSHAGEHYLNAVTGDYDLFGVWPFVKGERRYDASPYGDDHRPLGTVRGSLSAEEKRNVDHLERNFTASGQGTKVGNITPRIYMICQLINSRLQHHVLSHSDETARPFLDDVDLPVIAFTPVGNFWSIETIFDFKVFIRHCVAEGIHVVLSNAWAQEATAAKPNRLGTEFMKHVPENGTRIIVPDWYNR